MEHFKLYVLLDGSTPVDNDSEGENLLENSSTPHKFDKTLPTSVAHYDEVERLNYEWGKNLLLKSNETTIQLVSASWLDVEEKTWREI